MRIPFGRLWITVQRNLCLLDLAPRPPRRLTGYSWFFADFESAADSPLAERLFSLEDVETVLVCECTVTITRKDKTLIDWVPLAKEVGSAIREVIQEDEMNSLRQIRLKQ